MKCQRLLSCLLVVLLSFSCLVPALSQDVSVPLIELQSWKVELQNLMVSLSLKQTEVDELLQDSLLHKKELENLKLQLIDLQNQITTLLEDSKISVMAYQEILEQYRELSSELITISKKLKRTRTIGIASSLLAFFAGLFLGSKL